MKLTFAVCAAAISLAVAGCSDHSSTNGAASGGKTGHASDLSKVEIKDIKVGDGATAENGDTLIVEYVGKRLSDMVQFDENMRQPGQGATKPPFSFTLDKDHSSVIAGWNEGMLGMKVGGERELQIPWSKAYGDTGSGDKIPPKSDLYFDVKLLGLIKKGKQNDFGFKDIKVGTGPEVKQKDWVTISFKAEHLNGFAVASTEPGGTAVQFQAGTNNAANGKMMLIRGLSYGVIHMKQGGERELFLPYGLIMNPLQRIPLPPGSLVKFDVKLLRVASTEQPPMKIPADAAKKAKATSSTKP